MVSFPFDAAILVVLVVVAFISGIGITTVGPGGIFVTIALFSLTPLSSGAVAGTAHATFVGTGLIGSAAYLRSGELHTSENRAIAIVLSVTCVVGALGGAYLNTYVSNPAFGQLLGGVAMAVGGVILYRERFGLGPIWRLDPATREGRIVLGSLGLVLGCASGLLGIGGPVLAVPSLVLVGVPMVSAVAIAQVQSIFIATFATTGYALQGAISLPLAVLVGLPLFAGVVFGWKVAHLVDPAKLKVGLGVVLIAIGPYLAL